ncbi:unnamed protein product [Allacma fusca]|uniref:Uncharacterized protein n=1 Tax=Allacma fusca TaxID=39272 RepID=A0A8J2LSC5_9HEXA|nr:unnamed protein product [Allacma fusca]
MLVFLGVVALLALTEAVPAPQVQILKSENEVGPNSYSYAFELSDGSGASQSGSIKNPQEADPEKRILGVTGEFRYTADNGQPVQVTYIADENGYQPTYIRSA